MRFLGPSNTKWPWPVSLITFHYHQFIITISTKSSWFINESHCHCLRHRHHHHNDRTDAQLYTCKSESVMSGSLSEGLRPRVDLAWKRRTWIEYYSCLILILIFINIHIDLAWKRRIGLDIFHVQFDPFFINLLALTEALYVVDNLSGTTNCLHAKKQTAQNKLH